MKLNIATFILLTFLTLIGGLAGTYFFATWETLLRPLRDVASMAVLITSLIVAGIFIVAALAKVGAGRPSSE